MNEIAYSYLRFSSKKQASGDSLRRQLQAGEDYCKKHNILLNPVNFKDLGVSAKEGKNAIDGALGEFLDCIDAGKIPKGSILLLDEFSRLSRDKVPNALQLFLRLLEHVDIVTLANEKRFSLSTIDTTDLIITITIMARAHEENQNRIRNISSAKQAKQAKLYSGELKTKLTSQCPFWLSLSEDKTEFIKDEDKVSIVKKCYSKSLNGEGSIRIMTWLNNIGFVAARGNKWGLSSISRLLKNPQVMGHFQPMSNGSPAGNIIEDYYPEIIEPKLYFAVQAARSERGKGSSGPTGEKFPNLFKGICKCYCGASMHYVTKGKGNNYLVCSNSRFGKGCEYISHRYNQIEMLILNVLSFLDFSKLKGDSTITLQSAIGELQEKLKVGKVKISNLTNSIMNANDSKPELLSPITDLIISIGKEIKELETELESKTNQLNTTINTDPTETYRTLQNKTIEDRTLLNQFLKRHIKNISFNKTMLSISFTKKGYILLVDYDATPKPSMTSALSSFLDMPTGLFHITKYWDLDLGMDKKETEDFHHQYLLSKGAKEIL